MKAAMAVPLGARPEKYEIDEDGFPREIVGSWARDKHDRLAKYVGISRTVRSKFIGPDKAGASFIDLYAGPGRARIKDSTEVIDGSALIAWKEALKGGAGFTQIHVADTDQSFVTAVSARLKSVNAPVSSEVGPANETVDRVLAKLDPYALHVAFLDPYNLRALPFAVIQKLTKFKRMDILLHLSIQDLQRNLRRYIDQNDSPLDVFAPGWRKHIDTNRSDVLIRGKILEYWRTLLQNEGMRTTEAAELVTGPNNQRLYWLAFAARHPQALRFWEKIRSNGAQPQVPLL